MRPGSSSPTMPTGRTLTPSAARLLAAFAPPPGTTVRSRCFKISTGASRDTREISPKINSSATRSPMTEIVTLGKDPTIFLNRSVSPGCFVISQSLRCYPAPIFSRHASSFRNDPQHGTDCVSRVHQFHFDRNDGQRLQCLKISAQVDGIFFRGDEAFSLPLLPQFQQILDIHLSIGVVVAVQGLRHRLNPSSTQLQQEILRA